MFEELNREFNELTRKQEKLLQLRHSLAKSEEDINALRKKLGELFTLQDKEDADVRNLEGLSLTGLFLKAFGNKERQLNKERQEYQAAKLKYDACYDNLLAAEKEAVEIRHQIAELGDLELQLQSLLSRKEILIKQIDSDKGAELIQLTEELAAAQTEMENIWQAIATSEAALSPLTFAKNSLLQACNWGHVDLITNETLANSAKYSYIENAKISILEAQRYLRRLSFQLSLMPQLFTDDLAPKIGGFASFADFFFDGLIVDWIIQSRIKESLEKVESLEHRVGEILNELREKMIEARVKAKLAENAKRKLLDSF